MTNYCEHGHITDEARFLPLGENSGICICFAHYREEKRMRQENFDSRGMPDWATLETQEARRKRMEG
jgi:hypothetical protein